MPNRFLTALPVFNEVEHVEAVLQEVLKFSPDVLVVDDGSTDGTEEVLARRSDVACLRHGTNRGYGAALRTAFAYADRCQYDILVTIDCDGQHEPQRIPQFVARCSGTDVDNSPTPGELASPNHGQTGNRQFPNTADVVHTACSSADSGLPDIVSGSRYLQTFAGDTPPPAERRSINLEVTAELNRRLDLQLTDSFCGFKAYRVEALRMLDVCEPGYAMPLELWVQAAHARLRIEELPVPLIYLEEKRSFGGALDDGQARLQYYRRVIDAALDRLSTGPGQDRGKVACSGDRPRC